MLLSPKKIPLPGVNYDLKLPKGYLSFSQIQMYTACPALYRAKYVLGMKDKGINKGRIESLAHHKAIELFLRYGPSFSDVLEEFCKHCPHMTNTLRLKIGELYQKVLPFYKKHFFDSTCIEQTFETIIAGVPVIGATDMRQDGIVWDSKFLSPKSIPKYKTPRSLQLMLYGYVSKVSAAGLVLVNKQTGEVELFTQHTVANAEQILENVVSRVAYGISVESFPLTSPDVYEWCRPSCVCWSKCYGK